MASNDTAAIEPAGSSGNARKQELQRVADALSDEMRTKAGATTRESVEALKARIKAMKRPANEAKVLDRLKSWRAIAPDIAIRSTFVVGFPGETEADFQYLLDWLDEAQLDRVGAFRFEPVAGAQANALPDPVPEEVKEERFQRIMAKTAAISAAKLEAKIGRTLPVIIDEVGEPDEDGDIGATGRSQADAPEIDGAVYLRNVPETLVPGDIVQATIEDADAHDLFGVISDR